MSYLNLKKHVFFNLKEILLDVHFKTNGMIKRNHQLIVKHCTYIDEPLNIQIMSLVVVWIFSSQSW